jgi:hypothetical protein
MGMWWFSMAGMVDAAGLFASFAASFHRLRTFS